MGSGDPDAPAVSRVLLLHGIMSSSATWWRVGPGLERRGWEPVRLDLPWHGDAPRPAREPDLEAFAAGVASRLDGPVGAVVGHSLGALVALELARRHDIGATRVVLDDPPAIGVADQLRLAEAIRADAEAVTIDPAALRRRERRANPRWQDRDVEHSIEGIARAEGALLADAVARRLRWDLLALVQAVEVPVHVLAASDVRASFSDEGGSALHEPARAALRALVGTARFSELPGGHCLHRDDAHGWVSVVDRALRS
jgi:pimeloyl-ACP methyl ester carboxylesterase